MNFIFLNETFRLVVGLVIPFENWGKLWNENTLLRIQSSWIFLILFFIRLKLFTEFDPTRSVAPKLNFSANLLSMDNLPLSSPALKWILFGFAEELENIKWWEMVSEFLWYQMVRNLSIFFCLGRKFEVKVNVCSFLWPYKITANVDIFLQFVYLKHLKKIKCLTLPIPLFVHMKLLWLRKMRNNSAMLPLLNDSTAVIVLVME